MSQKEDCSHIGLRWGGRLEECELELAEYLRQSPVYAHEMGITDQQPSEAVPDIRSSVMDGWTHPEIQDVNSEQQFAHVLGYKEGIFGVLNELVMADLIDWELAAAGRADGADS
jgi:hypothetical protein